MKLAKVNVVGPDLCVISGCYLVESERIHTFHWCGPYLYLSSLRLGLRPQNRWLIHCMWVPFVFFIYTLNL